MCYGNKAVTSTLGFTVINRWSQSPATPLKAQQRNVKLIWGQWQKPLFIIPIGVWRPSLSWDQRGGLLGTPLEDASSQPASCLEKFGKNRFVLKRCPMLENNFSTTAIGKRKMVSLNTVLIFVLIWKLLKVFHPLAHFICCWYILTLTCMCMF